MQFSNLTTLLCLAVPILAATLPPTTHRLPITAPLTYHTLSRSYPLSSSSPPQSRIKHYVIRIFTTPTSYADDHSISRLPCRDSEEGDDREGKAGWSSKLADNVIPWELEAASEIDDNELPEQAQSRPPKLPGIRLDELGKLQEFRSHRVGVVIPHRSNGVVKDESAFRQAGAGVDEENGGEKDWWTVTRYTITSGNKTRQFSLKHESVLEYALMILVGCLVAAGLVELWNLCRGGNRSRELYEDHDVEKGVPGVGYGETQELLSVDQKTAGDVAEAFRVWADEERELPPYR